MRAILSYGVVAAVLIATLASAVGWLVESAEPPAVWLAAAIAWPVQVLAFWALVAARSRPVGFMMGWAGGMALRFAAVGAVALWLTRTAAFDVATALVSLVGFVFVLVLLEPLFLRLAD